MGVGLLPGAGAAARCRRDRRPRGDHQRRCTATCGSPTPGRRSVYDRSDPEQVVVRRRARRATTRSTTPTRASCSCSRPALEPLGLHYTPAEVQAFRDAPRLLDMQTDYGRIRLSNSVLSPATAGPYLLQVGRPARRRSTTRCSGSCGLLLWSVPAGLLFALRRRPLDGGAGAGAARPHGRGDAARSTSPTSAAAAAARRAATSSTRSRTPSTTRSARLEQAVARDAPVQHRARARAAHAARGAARETELALMQHMSVGAAPPGPDRPARGAGHADAPHQPAPDAGAGRGGPDPARSARRWTWRCSRRTLVEQLEPVAQAKGVTLAVDAPAAGRSSWATPAGSSGCC